MKTTKELNELSNAIGQAICAYHKAVFENLKESGKEYKLFPTDDEDKGIYLEDDGMMYLIDKVRYAKRESGVELIEFHCCEYDYKEIDEWYDADFWCDDADYIYNSIIWDDEESDNTTKYVCPNCGHTFEQGEYNFNYDTALLDFVCPECDWEGNETKLRH